MSETATRVFKNVEEIKVLQRVSPIKIKKFNCTIAREKGRIFWLKSPFRLKDEIKQMAGSRWHGFDRDEPMKIWSVADVPRNHFQLSYLKGHNPYSWFDRKVEIDPRVGQRTLTEEGEDIVCDLFGHQVQMVNAALTYHFQLWCCIMAAGKTLAAIDVIEKSGVDNWIWCGPKNTLPQMEIEFAKWNLDRKINIQVMTYDALALMMDDGIDDENTPFGFIGDEASLLKNPGTRRANGAQKLADQIRRVHGHDGYVILMSGTPAAKTPCDIWNLAEIAYPGFLAEGSIKALEARLGIFEDASIPGEFGHKYKKRVAWKCDENICNVCGEHRSHEKHHADPDDPDHDYHRFKKSVNEVAKLHRRLDGLAFFVNEEDMELPDRKYIVEKLVPSKKLLRVARSVVESQTTTIKGINSLRQLSDGFSYINKEDGTKPCGVCGGEGTVLQWVDKDDPEAKYDDPSMLDAERVANLEKTDRTCPICDGEKVVPNMVRSTFEVPCGKEELLVKWLDIAEKESDGRICVFAGFQGSVDRCVRIAKEHGWNVFKLDGRGSHIETADGRIRGAKPLHYWADMKNEKVAFIANSASGGFGLTLVESSICVYYSNSHRSEMRTQSEARIRRPGQKKVCRVVDFINLPTDQRILDLVREDRRIEKMTLGAVVGDCLDIEGRDDE